MFQAVASPADWAHYEENLIGNAEVRGDEDCAHLRPSHPRPPRASRRWKHHGFRDAGDAKGWGVALDHYWLEAQAIAALEGAAIDEECDAALRRL